jgi:disulfide bond formation protein DsbB
MPQQSPSTNSDPRLLYAAVAAVAVILFGAAGACVWIFSDSGSGGAPALAADPARAAHGQTLFAQSCATCHGIAAQGLPHQGADLRHSRFVSQRSDKGLIEFLRAGRTPSDPESVMRLPMPPRGGNPNLSDQNLVDIVAYLRTVQQQAKAQPQHQQTAGASVAPAVADGN